MSLSRALMLALIALVVMSGLLIILHIWGILNDAELLLRLLGTSGVLVLIIGFLFVVRQDMSDHKRLKDQNYLD